LPAHITVYRVVPGAQPEPVQDSIGARDHLQFAYHNKVGKKRLAIFGVDEKENFYWYHPSITIDAGAGRVFLPPAPRIPLRGRSIRIYGIFSNEPLSVDSLERLVRTRKSTGDLLPIRRSVQNSIAFRVREGKEDSGQTGDMEGVLR
jgi:hypothetical protein